MLDILDFIAEKGGDVAKLSESQLRRNASTELIDQVIKLYEEHREGGTLFHLLLDQFSFMTSQILRFSGRAKPE